MYSTARCNALQCGFVHSAEAGTSGASREAGQLETQAGVEAELETFEMYRAGQRAGDPDGGDVDAPGLRSV